LRGGSGGGGSGGGAGSGVRLGGELGLGSERVGAGLLCGFEFGL
jgi:hypothetical protein